ncbi:MAG: tetratricopeptide repeat protein [Thermoanaerobaculum sp.]|nr:tetratricopeptide repeat protein [Thermoanaerobaculum sp.]MDW7967774.1 tetratricopeptide repeat protein [Thermoanaerobaculum sp.]
MRETTVHRSQALALTARAQLALAEGQVERGLKLFAQAVALDPDSPELREEYGLALANLGIREQALEQLRRSGPLSAEGKAVLGLLAVQTATTAEELQQAVGYLEQGQGFLPYRDRVQQSLIEAYLRLGQGEKAWGLVAPLLEDHKDNLWLHFAAGQALRQMGRLEVAEDYLRRARSAPELAGRATSELVELLAQQGKFRQAADLVGETVRQGGTPTLPGLVRWATLLLRAQDEAKAVEVLDEALARDPTYADALILRGAVAFRRGRVDEAEHFYRRALAVEPNDPDALVGLARLLLEVRRFAEARELLARARTVVAAHPQAAAGAEEEIVEEQAAVELVARQYTQALPFLSALSKGSLSRRGLALWAEYFRGQERYSEGLAFFDRASVAPDQPAALAAKAFRAEFALLAGQEEQGLALLAELASGAVEAVRVALSTLLRVKRYEQAVQWAQEGLRRFASDGELLFSLAAALERSGRFAEAEQAFRQLLAQEPDNASALNYLGYMFADRGVHLQEAKELIERAVALDPLSGAYLDSLGWVYFRLGDWDRAEKYLTQALALEPFDPTIHEHLGDLYQARGNPQRARELWQRALQLKPDEEGQAERIKEKLKGLGGAPAP